MSIERRPTGTFNVEKCVRYLRMVGVEIDDATARAWRDAEQVARYLRNVRKPDRKGLRFGCAKGHSWTAVIVKRGKGMRANNAKAKECPECGRKPSGWSLVWTEAGDGTVKDYRPESERWKPMPHFDEADR